MGSKKMHMAALLCGLVAISGAAISPGASADYSPLSVGVSPDFEDLPPEVQQVVLDDLAQDALEEGHSPDEGDETVGELENPHGVGVQARMLNWPEKDGGIRIIGEGGNVLLRPLWFAGIRDAMKVREDLVDTPLFENAEADRVRKGLGQVRAPREFSRDNGPWHLYKISYRKGDGQESHYKYGLTRQVIPDQRPRAQLKSCEKVFETDKNGGLCDYDWVARGFTGDQRTAEGLERTMILQHYIKTGTCGPGHGASKCA